MLPLLIGVAGGAKCPPEIAADAEEIGRRLAERGAILVCGGRGGVMEAAARGARQVGGLTVGILPGFNAQEANPHIAIPIVTGLSDARNAIIARTCAAIIAVDGRFGTLSEIALALKMGVPVVGYKTWEVGKPLHLADSPEVAVDMAVDLARGRKTGTR